MYELLSTLLKYIFITIIYVFIFAIIRMIYLDIDSMNSKRSFKNKNRPYLKLLNLRESLDINVEESYLLEDGFSIGRSRDNGIAVEDPFISGEHAVFVSQDEGYLLKDMNSKNGTFVNGNRLEDMPVRLKDGDRIKIGVLDFLYVENRG